MKAEQLDKLIASAELRNPKVFNDGRERYLAEIAFKAGEKQGFEAGMRVPTNYARKELKQSWGDGRKSGIREVMGLLDKPCPHTGGIEEQQMRAIDCEKCRQAQLKSWGL